MAITWLYILSFLAILVWPSMILFSSTHGLPVDPCKLRRPSSVVLITFGILFFLLTLFDSPHAFELYTVSVWIVEYLLKTISNPNHKPQAPSKGTPNPELDGEGGTFRLMISKLAKKKGFVLASIIATFAFSITRYDFYDLKLFLPEELTISKIGSLSPEALDLVVFLVLSLSVLDSLAALVSLCALGMNIFFFFLNTMLIVLYLFY